MIDEYGTLQESKGVFTLTFERFFPRNLQEVYSIIINPNHFIKWYPFATGEMEPRIGGKIFFDDGEGTTYEGIITEFKPPYLFSFQEEPCAMSNAIPKKYVKIVYANEEQSNSNILETVHQLIAKEFSKKYPNLKLRKDNYLNIIDYETIKNGELIGQATLYEENDYKTSPSFGADYKYNPHLNKIKVDFYKN